MHDCNIASALENGDIAVLHYAIELVFPITTLLEYYAPHTNSLLMAGRASLTRMEVDCAAALYDNNLCDSGISLQVIYCTESSLFVMGHLVF